MEYLNFELEIGAGNGNDYPVTVIDSPAGEAHETMHFPFDGPTLKAQLAMLQVLLLSPNGSGSQTLFTQKQAVQSFGQALFTALFTGAVHDLYRESRSATIARDQGLRVMLRIQPAELSVLPWEYLYDPREEQHLCLSDATPVVRYYELAAPFQPLSVTLPLSILAVAASPTNAASLDIEGEKRRIEAAVSDLVVRGLVKLTWLTGRTWEDMQQAMQSGPWHIFHFSGHGGFDPDACEGFIALEDSTGQVHPLLASQLALLLADHSPLQLVVLNSCNGALATKLDMFGSTAATLIRRGIPAVVANHYEITDQAATQLARAFYQALAVGEPVDMAVGEARKAIYVSGGTTVEWGVPVLSMHTPDGILFDLKPPAGTSGVPSVVPPTPLVAQPALPPPAVATPPDPAPSRVTPAPGPVTPRDTPPIPVPPPQPPQRTAGEWGSLALLALVLVALIASGVIFFMPRPSPTPTGGPGTPSTSGRVVGHLSFLSSEQISDLSNQGIADDLQLFIHSIRPPAPGKSYYVWLLPDNEQLEEIIIPLGTLQVSGESGTLSYSDPRHTNLLASWSRLLVTEEDASVVPVAPSPDTGTWRYLAQIPNTISAGSQFSFLSHLRHLLSEDPKLATHHLSGGLVPWFYRNVQSVYALALTARDAWRTGSGTRSGTIRQDALSILEYLDGSSYAQHEVSFTLPASSPATAQASSISLLQEVAEQDPPGYLSHIILHLLGLLSSPGAPANLRNQVSPIVVAINTGSGWLQQVRRDAIQLTTMSDDQLKGLQAGTLLNDMAATMSTVIAGKSDATTGNVEQGAEWIKRSIEALASIDINPYSTQTQNNGNA